jgi:hypothetical protein
MFQFIQVAIGEINHPATIGADEVVMVLGRTAHRIATATSAGMHLADKAKLRQDFYSTVNGYQPDGRVFTKDSFVEGGRRKVLMGIDNHTDNDTSLWCNLVAFLAKGAYNPFFSIDHFIQLIENDFQLAV